MRKSFSLEGIQYWKVTSDYNIWKLSIENMRKRKKQSINFPFQHFMKKELSKSALEITSPSSILNEGDDEGDPPRPPRVVQQYACKSLKSNFRGF